MVKRKIEIEDMITVGSLAEKLDLPVSHLITELMKNGVMATVNERIDFDTAQIIINELGLEVELVKKEVDQELVRQKTRSKTSGQPRPPVVAVMGHIDHGKTSLLDAIRGSDVVKGEAGGITQHISAYQISHNDRFITFLDTPGHEAFSALRRHGAKLTDLVIVVVAADDGVKPQTIEAIRFAREAKVKMLVAINKVDKPGADINKVKAQLAEQKVLLEGYGGDTVAVEVSATNHQGVDQLLDMVLLIADVEELKAETNKAAAGLIIEAHVEKGRGPVGIGLIEEGILKSGQYIVAGSTYAKIRNLESSAGQSIESAGPATPVIITGFKNLPRFGDEFEAVIDERTARQKAEQNTNNLKTQADRQDISGSQLISLINRKNRVAELNIVIKADVQGSLKSVADSLRALNTDEVAVRLLGSGIGSIGENDIHVASTSHAIIYGFNVVVPTAIKQIAAREKVSIRLFKVIYELIDDVKAEMTSLLKPQISETELGRLVVKAIFKLTKNEVICGGEVTKGKLSVPATATIVRDKKKLAEVEITGLKRGPQDVKEVSEGEMCGVSFKSSARVDLQEGDWLEFFSREQVERKL